MGEVIPFPSKEKSLAAYFENWGNGAVILMPPEGEDANFTVTKLGNPEPSPVSLFVCTACGNEWGQVIPEYYPMEEEHPQCPECLTPAGRKIQHCFHGPDEYRCNCGRRLFAMNPKGTYCIGCGTYLVL